MKLHIIENDQSDLFNLLNIPTDTQQPGTIRGKEFKSLKQSLHICSELYKNKQLRETEPDRTGFKKIPCRDNNNEYVIFTNGTIAYILIWHNQKKYWYDTHL